MWSWERELGSRETNYRLDVGRFPGKARCFSLLQYAAHPAFYSKGNGCSSTGGKAVVA